MSGRTKYERGFSLIAVVLILFGLILPTFGSERAESDLTFGMSTALTGPAADLGLNMRAGVEAAFAERNRQGGVRGRSLKLIVLDDGYDPLRTGPEMETLVKNEQVLGIVGNVGTPTAVVALPICNRERTLFFGAYTGAGILRKDPPDRYVINYRASYAEETAAMVEALIHEAGLKPSEIAFFTQRDAYGDAGYVGGIEALQRHGLVDESKVAHGRFERNTTAIENGLADVLSAESPAKAVIMVGTYEPCARFIHMAKEFGLDAIFLNVSFVGAEALCRTLRDHGDGVIVTQVVPHTGAGLPVVREFRSAISAVDPSAVPASGALEGYICGRILIRGLDESSDPITRESIVHSLEALGAFDIGLEESLMLGPEHHQACHTVWPTVIQRGTITPCQWTILKSMQGGQSDVAGQK